MTAQCAVSNERVNLLQANQEIVQWTAGVGKMNIDDENTINLK